MAVWKWVAWLGCASATALPSTANAAVTVIIDQAGPGVIVTTSGTLDLTGLTSQGSFFSTGGAMTPSVGFVSVGIPLTVTGYSGLSGPSSFGTGNITFTNISAGTPFAINGGGFASPYVFVPTAYVSGSAIGAQATWLGQTFASLGLTPGQYVFTAPNDTITVNIRPVGGPVPEPSAWAMMLLGLGAIGVARRRRRSKVSGICLTAPLLP